MRDLILHLGACFFLHVICSKWLAKQFLADIHFFAFVDGTRFEYGVYQGVLVLLSVHEKHFVLDLLAGRWRLEPWLLVL
jgi:hypothetical protein